MAAVWDHIVAQLDAQGFRWPCCYRVKKRKIQDRLCFGLAVEAQQQGDFLLLDNDEYAPAGLTRTLVPSTPSLATAAAPNATVDSALDSALDPALAIRCGLPSAIAQYYKTFAVKASCNVVQCGAECCRAKVAYKFWESRNVSNFVIASSNPFSLLIFRASPRETLMIS